MNTGRERNIGVDIVKAIAVMFVISVHFFWNTNFYTTPIIGKNMYYQVILQQIFLSCVPLFMITTGYLSKNTTIDKKYYKKLVPIIIIYLIYSILALITRYYLGEIDFDIKLWIREILTFNANPYSWYVNMFIGLYIIAPFLNILYENLKCKEDKIKLIFILILLTGIPSMINGKFLEIIYFPYYWINIYPLTYYFIGKFLNEYEKNIKLRYSFLIFIIVVIIQAIIEIYYANKGLFQFYLLDYNSLFKMIQATVLFIFLYKLKIRNNNFKKIITLISNLSLDIYLLSYIIDKIIYLKLQNYQISQQQIIYMFIPIIGLIFILCIFISYLRKLIIKVR